MFDILILNSSIVDGTGEQLFKGDIGIAKGMIVKIGHLKDYESKEVIDAKNLLVAPGFIDSHSHMDVFGKKNNPFAINKITQGITTEISGQCGFSLFPLNENTKSKRQIDTLVRLANKNHADVFKNFELYSQSVKKNGLGYNIALLVGHGMLRTNVIGLGNDKASPSQIEKMKEMLDESMSQGALGLSTGLEYVPGIYSNTDELIELAKVSAKYNGIYTTHLRNQNDNFLEAVQEAIEIGRQAGVRVIISHIKAANQKNWGKVQKALKMIDEARAEGLDIYCDFYPYTASNTTIMKIIPKWAIAGGYQELKKNIENDETREKIIKELESKQYNWENIVISRLGNSKKIYYGKSIKEISKEFDHDIYSALFNLILENNGIFEALFISMSEEDIDSAVMYEHSVVGSDTTLIVDESIVDYCHPRNYGTFPKIIRKYVKENSLLTLEEAISKMTYKTAQIHRLNNRGAIKEDYHADIVIFDLDEIKDMASIESPASISEGIKYVIINGKIQYENGKYNKLLCGEIIKKED